jgi:hypothetical protein
MMYVPYPEMPDEVRLAPLEFIDWGECCTIESRTLSDTDIVSHFEVEMLAERPVLRLTPEGLHTAGRLIDLRDGLVLPGVSHAEALSVALLIGRIGGQRASPRYSGLIDYDQWTVSGARFDRPLFRLLLDDDAKTQLYVSSATGKPVQMTTARERFWNYLGAIPHWLYFSKLRHNSRLWSRVVIYASLTGCLLALSGLGA